MIGVAGILLSLGLIMYLAYRGLSVLLLGPALAILAALFTANSHPLGLYTQVFMNATGSFIITFFPLFLLGALFGKLMDDSGAAQAIATPLSKRSAKNRRRSQLFYPAPSLPTAACRSSSSPSQSILSPRASSSTPTSRNA